MKHQTLTIAEAQRIAEDNIRRRISQSERLSRYQFGPVVFERDDEYFWTFVSGSKQLQDEGWVPGALHACVDKVDGHVWTSEEMEEFFTNLLAKEAAERAAATA